jgi:diguanylate cyclase (GGDEF)-like protein
LIAISVLAGWLIPAVGSVLPNGWMLMKVNTTLVLLCSVLSLGLARSKQSKWRIVVSRTLAVVVFLMAITVLLEYSFHISVGIGALQFDTLLAADSGSSRPGRMSPQTASSFALLAIVMFFIRVWKRSAGHVVDILVFCLCQLVMVIVAGYAFGVLQFFGISSSTRTAPQTLLCLLLLSFVAFGRRTEYGFFSILLGTGIGSKIARYAAPCAVLVPFALEAGRAMVGRTQLLSTEYSTALITSLAAVIGFGVLLLLAWRVYSLEEDIHDLSLRDDLTKLFNRRGFLLQAERALQTAQRSESPFSVLFIDLDGLKQVNDSLGHETGSAFLCEMAELLRESFRESDVIGRIGGDEFVVAGLTSAAGIHHASRRLEESANKRNQERSHAYSLSFSLGYVTSEAGREELLEDLMNRADIAMYATKRSKVLSRG